MSTTIEREDRRLIIVGDRVAILFPYVHGCEQTARLVAAVKLIKGVAYRSVQGRKCWSVPARLENLRALADFAKAHEFTPDAGLHDLCMRLVVGAKENLAGSRAADAPVDVTGLGGVLDPFQRAGVAYLMRNRRVLLADEMGLGKTIQALAALRGLGAFPAIIVCPAFLALNWQREAAHWLPSEQTHILGKDGPLPTSRAAINIVSYDRMTTHVEGLRSLDPAAVVFDEGHFLKDHTTQRAKAALALVKGVETRFLLTGTPLVNRPLDLLPQLHILGRVDDLGGARTFKQRYCEGKMVPTWIKGCRRLGSLPCEPVDIESVRAADPVREREGDEVLQEGKPWLRWIVTGKTPEGVTLTRGSNTLALTAAELAGWFRVIKRMDASGAGDLALLGRELRRVCMIRRRKEDVLTELPPKRRAWVPVELSNGAEYQRAEADVLRWIGDRAAADPAFQADLRGLTAEDKLRLIVKRAHEAASRAERCEELVRVGVLLRLAAEGKVAQLEAWVRSFLESGESLVLFGRTVEVLKSIAGKFGAPLIIGEVPDKRRQAIVDAFQAGKERLICLSYGAGGVGLTLTKASNVVSLELPWTSKDLDQGEDRCHRRGQRGSVSCWHFLARGTVDYMVRELVEKKRELSEAALR